MSQRCLSRLRKADDTQSRFRRRKSSPKISDNFWTVCHTDLVPDFSGTRFWHQSLRVLFHADFWYTRDHYSDRCWSMSLFSLRTQRDSCDPFLSVTCHTIPHRQIHHISEGLWWRIYLWMTFISVDCHCRRLIVSDIFVVVGVLEIGAQRHQREQQRFHFVSIVWWFLADRTIGRAYGTVCRLSVVRPSVTFCIVAKRCVLVKKCLKEWNQGQKVHFLGRRHISTSGFGSTATEMAVFGLFLAEFWNTILGIPEK